MGWKKNKKRVWIDRRTGQTREMCTRAVTQVTYLTDYFPIRECGNCQLQSYTNWNGFGLFQLRDGSDWNVTTEMKFCPRCGARLTKVETVMPTGQDWEPETEDDASGGVAEEAELPELPRREYHEIF